MTADSTGAVEALAEAWAQTQGWSTQFADGRSANPSATGHNCRAACAAQAGALLTALHRRGYTVTPIVANGGAGEGVGQAEASQAVYRDAGDISGSVEALRAAGWTVIAPVDPNGAIPDPKPGQVWVSPKPTVEPRTVVCIGPHRTYPWAGDRVVGFTTPKRAPTQWGPPRLTFETWLEWAKKSGARPQETTP